MDECDLAAKAARMFLRQSLTRARAVQSKKASRTVCLDCGEPIPEARQKAVPGCLRCVHCETDLEQNVRR